MWVLFGPSLLEMCHSLLLAAVEGEELDYTGWPEKLVHNSQAFFFFLLNVELLNWHFLHDCSNTGLSLKTQEEQH